MPRPLPRPLLDPSLRDKVLRGGVRLQGSSFQPGGRGMEGLAIPIVIVLALGIMTLFCFNHYEYPGSDSDSVPRPFPAQ